MLPSARDVSAMAETSSKLQVFLARLVVVLVVAFLALGAILYGFSAEVRQRVWQDLLGRPGGPMTFRFILQPIMAALAALLDGVKDAKAGRTPYFWTLLTSPSERFGRLYEGVMATSRVILLGLCMDVIYQLLEFKTLYPAEAAIVALALAYVPYLLLRGPIARFEYWRRGHIHTSESR
jgi:hypothetical protein